MEGIKNHQNCAMVIFGMDMANKATLSTKVLKHRMIYNEDPSEREARSNICTGVCMGGSLRSMRRRRESKH